MKIKKIKILSVMIFLILTNFVFSDEIVNSINVVKEVEVKTENILISDTPEITLGVEKEVINNNEILTKKNENEEKDLKKYKLENYEVEKGTEKKGKATYYSKKFHGKKTASGEKFSVYEFTAAHRTLQYGTMVKVTNLDNGKSVIVKINDRGPFSKNKIIDISPTAFEELASLKKGILNVKIEVVKEILPDIIEEKEEINNEIDSEILPVSQENIDLQKNDK